MSFLPILRSLEDPALISKYSCFLLDAWGVFWGSNAFGAYPGAQATMEKLVLSGKIIGILSNSSAPAQKEIDKYQKAGFIQGRHFHFLVTSGEIAKNAFEKGELPFPTPNKKYSLLFPPHPTYGASKTLFEKSPFQEAHLLEEADFAYISVPHMNGHDQTNIDLFRPYIQQCVAYGKPAVCANPDFFAHEGTPPVSVVRQGSIAALYKEYGGEVFYFGKPHVQIFHVALEKLKTYSLNPQPVLMVGDTPETDIGGAVAVGIDSALVCGTGNMKDRIMKHGEKALLELPPSLTPTFCIERFASHEL